MLVHFVFFYHGKTFQCNYQNDLYKILKRQSIRISKSIGPVHIPQTTEYIRYRIKKQCINLKKLNICVIIPTYVGDFFKKKTNVILSSLQVKLAN